MSETLSDSQLEWMDQGVVWVYGLNLAKIAAAEIRTLRATLAADRRILSALVNCYDAYGRVTIDRDSELGREIDAALGLPLTEKGN